VSYDPVRGARDRFSVKFATLETSGMQKSHIRGHPELLTHSFLGDSGRLRYPPAGPSSLKVVPYPSERNKQSKNATE
jgi:hypothetical protein